mmetsp:Transcript_18029/g.39836  ORF Transcript_18029/g.39836 Transcript_18029/m.39836 type:complete len:394 (-) Transcript_18029:3-1184(-)
MHSDAVELVVCQEEPDCDAASSWRLKADAMPAALTAGVSGAQPSCGTSPGMSELPDELRNQILLGTSFRDAPAVRAVCKSWRDIVDGLPMRPRATLRRSAGFFWGSSMSTASRRLLRAGRLFALWMILNFALFPVLVAFDVLVHQLPVAGIFAPTWVALGLALYIGWTSIRLRRVLRRTLRFQAESRRSPLLLLPPDLLRESVVLNVLHIGLSVPLPLVHISILQHEFVPGCLMAILPSWMMCVLASYAVLRHRCKFHAILGMLSSFTVIVEWSLFPACLLPLTVSIPWYRLLFWFLPVMIPYALMLCFAVEASAYGFARAIGCTVFGVLSLHFALFGWGLVFVGMSSLCLGCAASIIAMQFWRLSRPGRYAGAEGIDSVFLQVAFALEGVDD